MAWISLVLLSSIITIGIPILLIVLIIRALSNKKNKDGDKSKSTLHFNLQNFIIICFSLSALIVGLSAFFMIPEAFFNAKPFGEEASISIVVYLTISMLLLILGMMIKKFTGKFLMILSLIMLVAGVLPFLDQFSSAGGFLVVLVIFIALVTFTVKNARKTNNG